MDNFRRQTLFIKRAKIIQMYRCICFHENEGVKRYFRKYNYEIF